MEAFFAPFWQKLSLAELVAMAFGLASVILTVRESVWCWPVGIVMVALYIVIFWRQGGYAQCGLQVVFLVVQVYGWYEWLWGGQHQEELKVSRMPAWLWGPLLGLGVVGTAGLGTALWLGTGEARPYWDAGLTVFSLIAQWL